MYDVGAVQRSVQAAYNMAPNPVSFLSLVSGSHAALNRLRGDFAGLPSELQSKNEAWAADAAAYDARLTTEHAQAQKIITAVQEGTLDLVEALKAGTDYAKALKKYLMDGDAAHWAKLANELAAIRAVERPESFIARPWLLELWLPWTAAQNLVIEELAEGAATSDMASGAFDAMAKYMSDGAEFVKDTAVAAGLGLVAILGIALGVYLLAKD